LLDSDIDASPLSELHQILGCELTISSQDRSMIDFEFSGKITSTRQPVAVREGASLQTAQDSSPQCIGDQVQWFSHPAALIGDARLNRGCAWKAF